MFIKITYKTMTNRSKSSLKSSSPMRGQLSIFAALIFQVLFILFAMSLNIALVVHDKINLQNSVDLAAYYGAMKQAQMLNAIAHINYQIRQSWKLLAWRNKVLGNIGTDFPQPLNEDKEFIPRNFNQPSPLPGTFITCIGHEKWHHPSTAGADSDNTCHSINGQLMGALEIGPSQGSFHGFSTGFDSVSKIFNRQGSLIGGQCKDYGKANWLFAATIFANWMKDQSDRKLMIYHLAQHMARGKDLKNELVKEGSRKTLVKNLSFVNKKSLTPDKLQFFNSLKNSPPEKWLKDHTFFVNLMYAYSKLNGNGDCVKYVRFIDQSPPVPAAPALRTLISFINNLLHQQRVSVDLCKPTGSPHLICPGSAGLNKKRDFLVFYGVKAELDYKGQIFLPFGDIKLKAEAYAKPFGGRIGPYNPPEKEKRADRLLPLSLTEAQSLPHQTNAEGIRRYDLSLSPNYSRYPGDHLGLRSHIVQHHWFDFLKKQANTTKDITHYSHGGQDPLAFKAGQNRQTLRQTLPARQWEVAAIAPDLFDTTYFTILPSYSEDYFGKIKTILESQNQGHIVRGDLGWRADFTPTGPPPHTSLTRHQITDIWDILKNQDPQGQFSKPFYKLKDLSFLLTGWNPPKVKYQSETDYRQIQNSNFGTCHKWDRDIAHENLQKRVAGACVEGGRTGYSVKMISRNYLEGLGTATGTGSLSQPNPTWW